MVSGCILAVAVVSLGIVKLLDKIITVGVPAMRTQHENYVLFHHEVDNFDGYNAQVSIKVHPVRKLTKELEY